MTDTMVLVLSSSALTYLIAMTYFNKQIDKYKQNAQELSQKLFKAEIQVSVLEQVTGQQFIVETHSNNEQFMDDQEEIDDSKKH